MAVILVDMGLITVFVLGSVVLWGALVGFPAVVLLLTVEEVALDFICNYALVLYWVVSILVPVCIFDLIFYELLEAVGVVFVYLKAGLVDLDAAWEATAFPTLV